MQRPAADTEDTGGRRQIGASRPPLRRVRRGLNTIRGCAAVPCTASAVRRYRSEDATGSPCRAGGCARRLSGTPVGMARSCPGNAERALRERGFDNRRPRDSAAVSDRQTWFARRHGRWCTTVSYYGSWALSMSSAAAPRRAKHETASLKRCATSAKTPTALDLTLRPYVSSVFCPLRLRWTAHRRQARARLEAIYSRCDEHLTTPTGLTATRSGFMEGGGATDRSRRDHVSTTLSRRNAPGRQSVIRRRFGQRAQSASRTSQAGPVEETNFLAG